MHDQVGLAGEALPAVVAGVRQLARVRPIVQPQLPGGQKGLPANGAKVIPLALVHLHVSQVAVFAEVFLTDLAEIGGAVVHKGVLLECMPVGERLVALVALEHSSFFVNLLVIVVARKAHESFLALHAAVAKVVQLQVGLHLIWMFKDFLACGTFPVVFRKVFLHGSCTQKPFILTGWLFAFPATFLFGVVLLFLLFYFSIATFPRIVHVLLLVTAFHLQVLAFWQSLASPLYFRFIFLNGSGRLDALSNRCRYRRHVGTLRGDEGARNKA